MPENSECLTSPISYQGKNVTKEREKPESRPQAAQHPGELSGWLLPDATFVHVAEWWHISYLYDLRDNGMPMLQEPSAITILSGGDESSIRNLAAQLGFVKISRGEIDANGITDAQLAALQCELELFDPSFEFRLLINGGQAIKTIAIDRLMKLKSARNLFRAD